MPAPICMLTEGELVDAFTSIQTFAVIPKDITRA